MLPSDELQRIANLKRLSIVNGEKDYLQEAILFSLYSKIKTELVFKGGTCLYKVYKLNRFSEDLDFTYTERKDIKKIIKIIPKDLALLNIKAKIKEIKEFKNEINVRLLLNGPLYKGSKQTQCFIPLNISIKEKVVLEPKKMNIMPYYTEIPNFDVFVMQEKELLSEKIRAIYTRDKPRDIYDLWFLLIIRKTNIDFRLINQKLKLYNLIFDKKTFQKALKRKQNLWKSDLQYLVIGEAPDFKQVQKEIFDKIKSK